ncbi:MAG: tetratricopeptide repeat protein [Thermoguttaceae bacterium]|nr:tetratricopeptide repeat protein [Thermoguttaceae bacterium]
MPYRRLANFMRARSFASRACALSLAMLSLSVGGCALWIYDDEPCCPPPPPVPETVYLVPEGAPGTYIYAPGAYAAYAPYYYRGQAKETQQTAPRQAPAGEAKASYLTRGQDAPAANGQFPTADDPLAPPESSELADFVSNGIGVPEPSGQYEAIDDKTDFSPTPNRESLSEREKTERELDDNFNEWLREKKAKKREESKGTKKYLQPLEETECDAFDRINVDEASIRQMESSKKTGEKNDMIDTVTFESIQPMLEENGEATRDLYDWEEEEPTPINWAKYAPSINRLRDWLGMGPDERAALEFMRQACQKQKEYSETRDKTCLRDAARLYERAAKRWPGPISKPDYSKKHPYAIPKRGTLIEEDGVFYAGECWFFYRDFPNALSCYRALVSTYPNSIYKNTAMKRLFYIGTYWVKRSEESSGPNMNVTVRHMSMYSAFDGAEKAFSAIFLNDASDGGLAPDALFALANAYMRRGVVQGDGSYEVAARYYKQLYEFYPGNRHAEDASRLAMIALHKSYQGVFYDDAPLNEARQIAEAIIKSGRGNLDVAYEELENIKEEQAHRLYELGKYYEKRGSFTSSRSYYNRLVKEYPNTEYAVEGARRYGEIADKPAEVDQLSWVRPVMPFLPKSKNEYFEERPSADLEKIARRDESLDAIGKSADEPGADSGPAKLAESPERNRQQLH